MSFSFFPFSGQMRHTIRLLLCAAGLLLLAGCHTKTPDYPKEKDLEFTVVPESDLPDPLCSVIKTRKQQPFELTYLTEEALYLAVGYGIKKTGGYSITIPECYLSTDCIVLKTELLGPAAEAVVPEVESYPYVVIKLEAMKLPVQFLGAGGLLKPTRAVALSQRTAPD